MWMTGAGSGRGSPPHRVQGLGSLPRQERPIRYVFTLHVTAVAHVVVVGDGCVNGVVVVLLLLLAVVL